MQSHELRDAPDCSLSDMAGDLSQILDTALFFLTGGRDAGHVTECLVLQLRDLRAECTREV